MWVNNIFLIIFLPVTNPENEWACPECSLEIYNKLNQNSLNDTIETYYTSSEDEFMETAITLKRKKKIKKNISGAENGANVLNVANKKYQKLEYDIKKKMQNIKKIINTTPRLSNIVVTVQGRGSSDSNIDHRYNGCFTYLPSRMVKEQKKYEEELKKKTIWN